MSDSLMSPTKNLKGSFKKSPDVLNDPPLSMASMGRKSAVGFGSSIKTEVQMFD